MQRAKGNNGENKKGEHLKRAIDLIVYHEFAKMKNLHYVYADYQNQIRIFELKNGF